MEAVYQLKISLKHVTPPVWRRVLVSEDFTLPQLHGLIQVVMGWTNSHLHEFSVGPRGATKTFMPKVALDEMVVGDLADESEVSLHKVMGRPKDKLAYIYDFGDYWQHDIVLEKVEKAETDTVVPVCLAGRRACPPEDCGGLPGYEHLLEVLSDPEDEEHGDMLEWVGVGFDSEEFDLKETNDVIGEVDWEDPEEGLGLW